jgi:2-oxoglutarate ferredoxin oxidoreductase subunit beta
MHDGSRVLLRKVEEKYDPTDRGFALDTIQRRLKQGEYLTGLLYIGKDQAELHQLNSTPDLPLNKLPYQQLNPGPTALAKTLARYR